MNDVKPGSGRAYFLAARPKTLAAAFSPVIIGSALAYGDGGFDVQVAVLCAVFAALMQIAANFINDLCDYVRGSDRASDRLGPERACAGGWLSVGQMRRASVITLILAAVVGLAMLWMVHGRVRYGGLELLATGALCMLFAVLYSTHLSYRGLGDVAVLLFFGIVPVCATYYVQAACLSAPVVMASLACGLAVDALLTVNNYRDFEQDRLSGKRTLVARYGPAFGRGLYLGLGIVAALCCLPLLVTDRLQPIGFIYSAGGYLYLHVSTWHNLCAIGRGRELNKLIARTSRNILFLALLLAVALMS